MLLDSCGAMIGATGYPGSGMVTPAKKPAGGERPDKVRKPNPRISKARVVVARGIAHLKHWRVLSTRYRSDLSRIDTEAQVVAGRQRLHERLRACLTW